MKSITLQTIQWSTLSDIDDVDPITEKDYQVLADLQRVLGRHGYLNRFGICLLHKHFDLGPGEVLMEKTNAAKRISTLKVEQSADNRTKTIETMWRFDNPKCTTVCVQRCNYNNGHKSYHSREGR
jgi:hypothetical protein